MAHAKSSIPATPQNLKRAPLGSEIYGKRDYLGSDISMTLKLNFTQIADYLRSFKKLV